MTNYSAIESQFPLFPKVRLSTNSSLKLGFSSQYPSVSSPRPFQNRLPEQSVGMWLVTNLVLLIPLVGIKGASGRRRSGLQGTGSMEEISGRVSPVPKWIQCPVVTPGRGTTPALAGRPYRSTDYSSAFSPENIARQNLEISRETPNQGYELRRKPSPV